MVSSDSAATAPVVVGMYAFRTPDPARLAAFWGGLMDLPSVDGLGEDIAMLDFEHQHGTVTWLFQRADPGTASPGQQFALDLDGGAQYRAVADRAEALGGRRGPERDQAGARWIEMHDPDDNPFRIFAPRPE